MSKVQQLLPLDEPVDAAELVSALRAASRTFRPFDDRVTAFVSDLARYLRKDKSCRQSPAVGALAFWIRDASIHRLAEAWERSTSSSPNLNVVRRGVVFHLPPTNVDTLFAYSWLMSALMGNANVVRLSPRSIEGDSPVLLDAIGEVLVEHPSVAATMSFVTYDRDAVITEDLSKSDVRVVWGGDETVKAIRRVPMNPLGTEMAFGDRFSMAAFDAASVLSLDDERMDEVVRQFFNDSYWFDQLGCSSPRVVFWRGDDERCAAAERRFRTALAKRVELEGYASPVGAVMRKLVSSATLAADGAASSVMWDNPNMTIATQPAEAKIQRDSPGAGMFVFRRIETLTEIAELADRRDQTLSVFGFGDDELRALAEELNGAGLDRIVPVGAALNFDRYWDGWDLLDAFSRKILISG